MVLKLSELRVVAFTKFGKEAVATLWTLATKNLFLTA